MSKIETDEKNSVEPVNPSDSASPSRRDVLRLASQAAAAGVTSSLVACGGEEEMMPLPQSCAGVAATGAEGLAVGKAMRFDKMPQYQSFFVARDDKGFYALANVCNHSGCQTAFNEAMKTFDCPCHGSRYNFDGTLLKGPATGPFKGYPICRRADGVLFVDNSNFVVDLTQRVK